MLLAALITSIQIYVMSYKSLLTSITHNSYTKYAIIHKERLYVTMLPKHRKEQQQRGALSCFFHKLILASMLTYFHLVYKLFIIYDNAKIHFMNFRQFFRFNFYHNY